MKDRFQLVEDESLGDNRYIKVFFEERTPGDTEEEILYLETELSKSSKEIGYTRIIVNKEQTEKLIQFLELILKRHKEKLKEEINNEK